MPQASSTVASGLYHALIKTHHITSRKKVSTIKAAAEKHNCYALIRNGGVPGMMYVEGSEEGVTKWVDTVHRLRYKDYQLVARPSPVIDDENKGKEQTINSKEEHQAESGLSTGFHETAKVKEFAAVMEQKGIHSWFRKAMRYTSS